jgi:hypothetical protein
LKLVCNENLKSETLKIMRRNLKEILLFYVEF